MNNNSRRKQLEQTLTRFYQNPVAKVSLEIFLSISAVIFFAVFAIRPTLTTMADLVKEIEDKTKLNQDLQKKIAALGTVQASYVQVQSRLPLLDEAIPTSPKLIEGIKILEKVASEKRLIITNISVGELPAEIPTTVTEKSERKFVPVSITITGEYTQIRDYIESILGLRRVMIVDTIIFSKNDQRGQERLNATITIGLPYFDE